MKPPNKHRTLDVKRRRIWVAEQRREGLSFKDIGECLGVSTCRARQIYLEAEHDVMWRGACARAHLSRICDPGGPRDMWLEFYPPPDPRFDNMVPVVP